MRQFHQLPIRAAIAVLGLTLAGPSHGAVDPASSPAFERCMAHYGLEWRDWSRERAARRVQAQAERAREAEDQAAAWDKLATAPGISASLAIDYRSKANAWRARAEAGAETESNGEQRADLEDFCQEVVSVITAPAAAPKASPAARPKTATAKPRRKLRAAAKPRRIKRARTVKRRHASPRISLGIGFVGVGF